MPRPQQPAHFAVVCLGDSHTSGVGASSRRWSYPAQLQLDLSALTWSLFLYYPCLAPHLPDLLTIELISPNSLLAIGLIRPNSLLVGHWADFSQLPIKAIDMPTVHTRIPVEESALLATTACSTCNVQSVREENVCVPRTRALDHRHLHFPDTVRPPRTRAPRPL